MITVERDVIIVGAGPAGAICAAYLAKAGIDVLLLDKDIFPRDKACGDMQSEGIVTHVNALGTFDALDAIGTCLRKIKLISNNGREVVLPFECYCTPRYDFDAMMVDTAAKWGAEFRQGCRVIGIIKERGYVKGVKVKFRGKQSEIRSKLVIGADGAYSAVAKMLGVMREASSGIYLGQRAYFKGVKLDRELAHDRYNTYGVFCFDEYVRPGYIWILPTGKRSVDEGYCNVGMMVYDRDSYKGMSLQERFSKCLDSSPKIKDMLESAEQVSQWQGGKLNDITQNMDKAGNGFMLIGDAASVMFPIMNDGLSAAADSAKAAADAVVEAIAQGDFSEEFLLSKYIDISGEGIRDIGKTGIDEELTTSKEPYIKEQLKIVRLTWQSMYDPRVMDRFIERLNTDPVYKKRIINRMLNE